MMGSLTDRKSSPGIDSPLDIVHAVPRRHPWRWVSAAVVAVLLAQFIHFIVTNPNFAWSTVGLYVRSEAIVKGLGITLGLTVIAMIIGVVLGVLLAVCRISENVLLKSVAGAFIWFFRGTPTLVQLIFFYNLSALLPRISIGIPFGPEFAAFDTNSLITPLFAAILGLGLNEGAYMAEIIRGGILSVGPGQLEAGHAIGMTPSKTMRRIILPQAMKFIVPPTGNQIISMVKATSLVSVIALADLLYTAQSIYNRTFQTIPLLIVACVWYLIITSVLYVGQSFLEKRYGRSDARTSSSWFDFLRIRPKRSRGRV
ncbi:ABC transporter permease [Rhodococcus sp. 15-725-2-2b]|nr:ABC transporter permease [Rhodococcus sp. 06-469-3-2]OZD48784.1 ABC transporter permease [Rhodococcus sp. 06-1477-1A]OZE03326.1 ABC transporter permease [Rhodococcus sp. 05-2255-3C]OZE09713.1 ABC transporter permease [Rhodococcus sp. 05-2255-3B1]OZE14980.1 ABC transporter permease [Rhodococcus sp. 05-2255-2A2]OZE77567.1 ABC transporter permease [Rhodococcus sp. 15-725-2-2b]